MIRYHYRVGRKFDRTIYRQLGDSSSDRDVYLGIMDDASLAALVVKLLNLDEAFRHGDPHAEDAAEAKTVGERLRAGETVPHDDILRGADQ